MKVAVWLWLIPAALAAPVQPDQYQKKILAQYELSPFCMYAVVTPFAGPSGSSMSFRENQVVKCKRQSQQTVNIDIFLSSSTRLTVGASSLRKIPGTPVLVPLNIAKNPHCVHSWLNQPKPWALSDSLVPGSTVHVRRFVKKQDEDEMALKGSVHFEGLLLVVTDEQGNDRIIHGECLIKELKASQSKPPAAWTRVEKNHQTMPVLASSPVLPSSSRNMYSHSTTETFPVHVQSKPVAESVSTTHQVPMQPEKQHNPKKTQHVTVDTSKPLKPVDVGSSPSLVPNVVRELPIAKKAETKAVKQPEPIQIISSPVSKGKNRMEAVVPVQPTFQRSTPVVASNDLDEIEAEIKQVKLSDKSPVSSKPYLNLLQSPVQVAPAESRITGTTIQTGSQMSYIPGSRIDDPLQYQEPKKLQKKPSQAILQQADPIPVTTVPASVSTSQPQYATFTSYEYDFPNPQHSNPSRGDSLLSSHPSYSHGYYYDQNSGLYYNRNSGQYYDQKSGQYYAYPTAYYAPVSTTYTTVSQEYANHAANVPVSATYTTTAQYHENHIAHPGAQYSQQANTQYHAAHNDDSVMGMRPPFTFVPFSNPHSPTVTSPLSEYNLKPVKEKKKKRLSWFSKKESKRIIQDETETLMKSLIDPDIRSVHIGVREQPRGSRMVFKQPPSPKDVNTNDPADLGLYYLDRHRYEEALYYFSVAGSRKDPVGSFMYAFCLMYGTGIDPDPERAVKILKNVAFTSHYKMMTARHLAPSHMPETLERMQKTILRKSEASISRSLKNSNEHKVIAALCFYQLFLAYYHGEGALESKKLALDYLRASAVLDQPEAQLDLGLYYAKGAHGLVQDKKKAAHWLRKARDNGLELPPSSHWIDKEKYQ